MNSSFVRRYGDLGAIAGVGVAMAAWTWGTWADPLVDFGRELYLAWMVWQGRALHVDVATFNGPLSPFVNAFWFSLFGVSVRALVIGNLLVLSLLTLVLHRLFCRITTRATATTATLVFLVLFAFGDYDIVGNFNYVTPYSHELVHGLVLSIGALLALCDWVTSRRLAMLCAAALCVGLAFLTKPEVFVAIAIAAGVMIGMTLARNEFSAQKRLSSIAAAAVCAALPPLAAIVLLSDGEWRTGLDTIWTPYRFVLEGQVAALPFYQQRLGLDRPARSIAMLLASAAIEAAIVYGLYRLVRGVRTHRFRFEIIAGANVVLALLVLMNAGVVLQNVARPFPLLLAVVVWQQWRTVLVAKTNEHQTDRYTAIARGGVALFALVLLAKMGLNATIYRYGFVLAMPATLLLVVAVFHWLPARFAAVAADARAFRVTCAAIAATVGLVFLATHAQRISLLRWQMASGADGFRADERAVPMNAMVEQLQQRLAPTDRLAVLPEGALLNFLVERPSSVAAPSFLPPEQLMFDALGELRQRPPEYIVLVDRPMGEYGLHRFDDGDPSFGEWISAHYQVVHSVPGTSSPGHPFGMSLLKHQP